MNSSSGVNASSLKQMNKTTIIDALLNGSPLTKPEIAERTGLTFATVSNLLNELMTAGYVREAGYAKSGGGRKPLLYRLNPLSKVFFGVDVQVDQMVCVLMDIEGRLIVSSSVPFATSEGPHAAVALVCQQVREMLAARQLDISQVGGAGISTPGPVDGEAGIILSPPNMPGWRNVPFRQMVQEELQVPCMLEKDANAAAYGENRYGAGQRTEHMIYVMSDVGIGGGLIFNGHVYRGFLNDAGDIGHTIIDMEGPRCNCGGRGCVEAVASGIAIERSVIQATGVEMNLSSILAEAPDNANLSALVAKAGDGLGVAIASLCNALNPTMVILGGRLPIESELYFQHAQLTARQRMLPEFTHQIRIERAKLKGRSAAMGAAMLAYRLIH